MRKIPKETREQQLTAIPNLRFIGWGEPYKNCNSKAIMECAIDKFRWSTSVMKLLTGSGCPKCGGSLPIGRGEREHQISALPNIEFVAWESEYKNARSGAIVKCSVDGNIWRASVDDLVNGGYGCKRCAVNACKELLTTPEEDRIASINGVAGLRFVKWAGKYENAYSKAIVSCDNGHTWSSSLNNLINKKSRCPSCATYGFDPNKPGTLYVLRSKCGRHIKVGISNNHIQRVSQLRKSTPFEFDVIGLAHNKSGRVVASLEKEFHRKFEHSGFVDFDGATEWLLFEDELLRDVKNCEGGLPIPETLDVR